MRLDRGWRVTYIAFEEGLGDILAEDYVPEGWLTLDVPEEIHRTLRRAGAIRGNTYDKREGEEAWIEERDWVYLLDFALDPALRGEKTRLWFEGVDTFCRVYLNGRELGGHANMHTAFGMDVTGVLRPGGRNRLIVRIRSAVRMAEGRPWEGLFSITGTDRLFARKAQMSYGWDFCARCVTAGIWKGVRLEKVRETRLGELYFYTRKASPREAECVLEVTAEAAGPGLSVRARLLDGDAEVWHGEKDPGDGRAFVLRLARPRLWWPRPYGAQPLYTLAVALCRGAEVLEEREISVGIRTIEVRQEKQPDGHAFAFCVNGKRLFLRGANWVPLNTVFTDIAPRDYEETLRLAEEGRISMLRIWGGGIYEPEGMYDLCDRRGILLWQDFMLACGIYPQDGAFLEEMREEAEQAVLKYRNHACLAIWAGDNENGQACIWAGRPYCFRQDRIGNEVLREVCRRLDPSRFYLPTSPGSPLPEAVGGDSPESPHQGDTHLYIMSADPGRPGGRDFGKNHYKRVLGYRPRFVSEFGFISLMGKESFGQFNPRREPLRNPAELEAALPFVRRFLDNNDTDSLIRYSQAFNARALKYWIEYFRSLKGTCAGTLYWKFCDPMADAPDGYMFPSHMSAVDMYHRPRMTYYYTRRAYADVLVLLAEDPGGGLRVAGVSETDRDLLGTLTVSRRRYDGAVCESVSLPAVIRADAATDLYVAGEGLRTPGDRYAEYLEASFVPEGRCPEGSFCLRNRYDFADLGEMDRLALPEGKLELTLGREAEDRWQARLRAETYCRDLRLGILDAEAEYSDNYLDLSPGEERTIGIRIRQCRDLKARTLFADGLNVRRVTAAFADALEDPAG